LISVLVHIDHLLVRISDRIAILIDVHHLLVRISDGIAILIDVHHWLGFGLVVDELLALRGEDLLSIGLHVGDLLLLLLLRGRVHHGLLLRIDHLLRMPT